MKKFLSVILVLAFLLSVSVFAFAADDDDVGNVTSFGSYSGNITYKSASDPSVSIIYSANDKSLDANQKKVFVDGHEKLVNPNPGTGEIQYYVYVKCDKFPVDLEFTVTNTSNLKAKTYDGDKVTDLTINNKGDNTISVTLPAEGALYIYEAKGGSSGGGTGDDQPASPSVVGPVASEKKTSHKPPVECDIRITPLVDQVKLNDSQIELFNKGYKDLPNVVPADALVQYYVYVESSKYPVDAEFRISNINSLSAKLYDGSWTDLKVTDNKDGTVTVTIPSEGALAIFNGKTEQMKLTTAENKASLSDTAKAQFEAAEADLKDICPAGMKNAVFGYAESSSFPVSAGIKLDTFSEFVILYNIDGKWVQLDGNDNHDGTVTVSVPCEGCLAIFTK